MTWQPALLHLRREGWLPNADHGCRNGFPIPKSQRASWIRCDHGWVGPAIALFEYDPDPRAVLDPSATLGHLRDSIPERAVLCFYSELLAALPGEAEQVGELRAAHGTHPIWRIRRHGHDVAVFHPGVGAPLAAGFLEEAIVLGARKVVACGGCGVLSADVQAGQVIVPTEAVRDEGTSFHYLAPSRTVEADPGGVAAATSPCGAFCQLRRRQGLDDRRHIPGDDAEGGPASGGRLFGSGDGSRCLLRRR